MSGYFQKARELGEMLLASDAAQRLAEANLTNENTAQAKKEYDALVNQVLNMIKAAAYEDADEAEACGGCSCPMKKR